MPPTKINDQVYLGSKEDAEDIAFLLQVKITTIINVNYPIESERELDLVKRHKLGYIILHDLTAAAGYLLGAYRGTNEKQQTILVHCNDGVARAPFVVAMFLKHINKITIEEAYAIIEKLRQPIIKHYIWDADYVCPHFGKYTRVPEGITCWECDRVDECYKVAKAAANAEANTRKLKQGAK